jgi:hypothetical protein
MLMLVSPGSDLNGDKILRKRLAPLLTRVIYGKPLLVFAGISTKLAAQGVENLNSGCISL